MERKNINRGFKKLRVWQDAISLYVLAYKIFSKFPFELNKVDANSIDAAHSISRNISEGYCRRSLKEYLNHLNIALGSCGEFHSYYERFKQAHLPKSKDFLKQYPCFAPMLNKLWSLTWWAYIGASLVDPRFSIQYIGRYTKRAVMEKL